MVSTHSRPKAAGPVGTTSFNGAACFNSQPPEGGWSVQSIQRAVKRCFNSQPPEGGWVAKAANTAATATVSTHSRPKAAGPAFGGRAGVSLFQLTAARRRLAGGGGGGGSSGAFQLTAARRRLALLLIRVLHMIAFQLTAARRRLGKKRTAKTSRRGFNSQPPEGGWH